jgi:hypothetical protein
MGSPVSSTIAEIFLLYFEDMHIKLLLETENIIFYTHYVDDILITDDTKKTCPDLINTQINQIYTNIKLNCTHKKQQIYKFP